MELKLEERQINIELQKNEFGFSPLIDENLKEFSIRDINGKSFLIESAKGHFIAYGAEDEKHIFVNIEGKNYIFDKITEEGSSFDMEESSTGNTDRMKAPMPGSVVKVLVEPGQKVSEGDGIIIIEAMKMETTLYTQIDGIVKEINATQGEQVNTDKVLVLIERENTD